ncbi:TIR domain-containing protein [Planktothrix agardhii 1032]|uniref:nSTAND1 domain-containing NTPase n=1 Tax=Planktothrix agardhii TaxID=1160 RepID=UPI001D0B59DC|nr:TIR domain-containing protein [Planktothrix agardhii]MCB8779622.1 TIR domain-containing protein [Planktothrix agardhii 1031]MCF3596892.1 TIR domain-containing protein [Planktothrix agardhii 1032]
MSKQYSVFVSYADEDGAWVEGYLLNALEEAGLTCHSEAMFRLGVPRLIEFESAVKNSERTLLVISPAYLADNFVEFANLLFQSYGVDATLWPVVPIILNPVQELPMRLEMLGCLDATDATKQQEVIQRICEDFKKPVPTSVKIPDCPYPGMVPFKQEDSDRFFGRQREVNDLIQHLRLYPFLAVIGASGSGKSSLVFAGLIPQLQKTHLLGKEPWQIYSMRPGTTPITTLTTTLGCDLSSAEAITTKFKLSQKSLLVIDQFEEIFTLSPQDVTPFQEILLNLYKQPNFYVVLTVRADFYPQLMESTCFWREIKAHRYEVLPLDQMGLQEAILKPAEQARVFIEGTLLERLITTAAKEPGVLPLLQETLVLLWEKIERRYLPLRAYEALVLSYYNAVSTTNNKLIGIQVALAQRADAAIADLTDEQQIIARRVFLRLIQFGEGRADTRRQESVEALKARGDNDQIFEETLRYLADRRLLTLSGKEDKTRKVDISHEILISSWPQLQDWIIQRREAEQTRRRLIAKVKEWGRLGKDKGGLLDEFELVEAQHWLESSDAAELGSDDQLVALVELSKTAIEDEKQQKLEAQERELGLIRERLEQETIANENKQKALESSQKATEEEKKGRRIAQNRNRILAASLVVMAGLSAFAVNRMIDSRIQTINALSNSAKSLFSSDQQLEGMIEAIKAGNMVKKSLFVPIETKIHVATALQEIVANIQEENRLTGHTGSVYSLGISPDEKIIASASQDNTIILWNRQGEKLRPLLGHSDQVSSVRFSPNRQTIASASMDKTVIVWDLQGKKLKSFQFDDEVCSVAFSPNGEKLAASSKDGTIKIWTTQQWQEQKPYKFLPVDDCRFVINFNPDGQVLALAGQNNNVQLLNLNDGRIQNFLGHSDAVFKVVFSPDGQMLASASLDHTIKLWKIDGTFIRTLSGHTGGVQGISFSPDSKFLVSGSDDNTIKQWKIDGTLIQTLQGHSGGVTEVYFLNDGKKLVSSSLDGTIIFWDLERKNSNQIGNHDTWINQVSFSPDGLMIASASDDKFIKLWSLDGTLIKAIPGHKDKVTRVEFSPDGKKIVSASRDKTIKIWDIKANLIHTITGESGDFQDLSLSLDGTKIAAPSGYKIIKIWSLENYQLLQNIPADISSIWDVQFSSDSKMIASGGKSREVKLWALDGKLINTFPGHKDSIFEVNVSNLDQMIVSASRDSTVNLWNLNGNKVKTLTEHHGKVRAVSFSPNYKMIASASEDGTIKIWTKDGELIDTLEGRSAILDISFSPDGNKIVAAHQKNLSLWNLNLDELLPQSCHWLKFYLENNSSDQERQLCPI